MLRAKAKLSIKVSFFVSRKGKFNVCQNTESIYKEENIAK